MENDATIPVTFSFVSYLNSSLNTSRAERWAGHSANPLRGTSSGVTMRSRQRQTQGERFSPPLSKPKLRKGLWSPEEDEKLIAYIMNNGMLGCSWASVAKQAGLQRCGKSCRLRWINYLRPGLKRGAFSRQEERLIINLQSVFGNRWSQIAAHMPGRTDNEIKNYWNSAIKKKLKLKHHLSSPTNKCNTNGKSNSPCQSPRICNTNSVFSHANDALTSFHSPQPYMDAMPEGYQTPKNTLNVATSGESMFCVPGVSELKQEQAQNQFDEINQLISYLEMRNNDTATHINESVSSNTVFISPSQQAQGLHAYNTAKSPTCDELIRESCRTTVPSLEATTSADYSLGSTGITIPAVIEYECLTEKNEIDRWSTIPSCSNEVDGSHVAYPGAYTVHEAGISIVDDYKSLYEKTTRQSCPPLSFRPQFGAPAIKRPAGHSNKFQVEDDCRDRLNLRYDVNLGIPEYIDIYCRQKSNQLLHIDGGGVGDQQGFSIAPDEETNANPIRTLIAGGGSGPFQIESKGGAGQVTGWAHDDIYNLSTAPNSDFDEVCFS